MQLKENIYKFLRNASNMIADCQDSEVFCSLSAELSEMRQRIEQPLRVAVVGVMKAGKSTLMNAILKEKILYTATLEATYTVSWFKYGEKPCLTIVFNDGTSEQAPFSDLEKWTVRPKDADAHRLDDVKHVIIYYPNEILKKMELIDTPGLESTTDKASGNTRDFLGQKLSEDADKITSENASQAEAIIYAFSRAASGKDADILQAFKGDTSNSSPINAIGVFTKADMYWDCARHPEANPLQTVREACDGYKEKLRDKLYSILPVVAKAVETVTDIDNRTADILKRLSMVDTAVLTDFLTDASIFSTEPADDEMPVSPQDRAHVLSQFGQYGIYTLINAQKSGVPESQLVDYMYNLSGVNDACNIIEKHFGSRAFLIKSDYILKHIRITANKIKHDNVTNSRVVRICERITEDIDEMRENEQAFCELELLQAYYNGSLIFPDADFENEFLQITGENGSSCERRLGFCAPTYISELKTEAELRSKKWNGLANNFGATRQMNQAAEVIVRSCDSLYYHLDMLSGFND